MVKRIDVLKKFILTFIDQAPRYLSPYTTSERKHIGELLDLLEHCESKADIARGKLSKQLEIYCNRIRKEKEYYNTPFLWFSEIYFDNANLFLRVADFQASDFFNFLVQIIRGTSDLSGIFQLIREGTSLQDLKWEKLQYLVISSFKFPLTEEELITIKELYSYVFSAGTNGLNQKSIANYLKTRGISERKYHDFTQLLTLLDARWYFLFYAPAFGLKSYFVCFEVKEPGSLEGIFDLYDTTNTTLCLSRLYQIKDFSNNYIGYLVVPEGKAEQLGSYLHQCERQNKLELKEFTEILDTYRSTSLSRYCAGKGWSILSSKEISNVITQLTVKYPRKLRKKVPALFHETTYNHDWNYTQSQDPKKIISLICKIQPYYSYETLPKPDEGEPFTKSDIELLESLQQNKLCQPFFKLDRIQYEYSIDVYSIKVPFMPMKQISRLLRVLPHAIRNYTENSIVIWTPLSAQDRKWIQEDLEWEPLQIILYKRQQALNYNWFDPKTLQWRPPKILEDQLMPPKKRGEK